MDIELKFQKNKKNNCILSRTSISGDESRPKKKSAIAPHYEPFNGGRSHRAAVMRSPAFLTTRLPRTANIVTCDDIPDDVTPL